MENRILAIGLILVIISAVFACGCMEEEEYIPELMPCTVVPPNVLLTNYMLPSLEEVGYNLGRVTYVATFEINNPNQIPVYLDHIDYKIYLNNVRVADGTYSDSVMVSIPAMETKQVLKQDEIVLPILPDIQIVSTVLGTHKVNAKIEGIAYLYTEYGPLTPTTFTNEILDIPLR